VKSEGSLSLFLPLLLSPFSGHGVHVPSLGVTLLGRILCTCHAGTCGLQWPIREVGPLNLLGFKLPRPQELGAVTKVFLIIVLSGGLAPEVYVPQRPLEGSSVLYQSCHPGWAMWPLAIGLPLLLLPGSVGIRKIMFWRPVQSSGQPLTPGL
jgi:hypothetical protein